MPFNIFSDEEEATLERLALCYRALRWCVFVVASVLVGAGFGFMAVALSDIAR